jgi:hypothetical protein
LERRARETNGPVLAELHVDVGARRELVEPALEEVDAVHRELDVLAQRELLPDAARAQGRRRASVRRVALDDDDASRAGARRVREVQRNRRADHAAAHDGDVGGPQQCGHSLRPTVTVFFPRDEIRNPIASPVMRMMDDETREGGPRMLRLSGSMLRFSGSMLRFSDRSLALAPAARPSPMGAGGSVAADVDSGGRRYSEQRRSSEQPFLVDADSLTPQNAIVLIHSIEYTNLFAHFGAEGDTCAQEALQVVLAIDRWLDSAVHGDFDDSKDMLNAAKTLAETYIHIAPSTTHSASARDIRSTSNGMASSDEARKDVELLHRRRVELLTQGENVETLSLVEDEENENVPARKWTRALLRRGSSEAATIGNSPSSSFPENRRRRQSDGGQGSFRRSAGDAPIHRRGSAAATMEKSAAGGGGGGGLSRIRRQSRDFMQRMTLDAPSSPQLAVTRSSPSKTVIVNSMDSRQRRTSLTNFVNSLQAPSCVDETVYAFMVSEKCKTEIAESLHAGNISVNTFDKATDEALHSLIHNGCLRNFLLAQKLARARKAAALAAQAPKLTTWQRFVMVFTGSQPKQNKLAVDDPNSDLKAVPDSTEEDSSNPTSTPTAWSGR